MMRHFLVLLILTFISCSQTGGLSSGNFDPQAANSFEFNGLRPNITLDRDVFPSGKPITGQLYLTKEQMFRDIAEELRLNYSKSFYYYPNGDINNSVRIGQQLDTLNFEIYSNGPLKADTTTLETFAIKANFTNLTNSYDTTFIMSIKINWN